MSKLTLNEVFRFGDVELEQNRKGNISDYQQRLLRRGGKIAFIAIVLLGLLIALGVYYVNKGKNDTPLMRASITFGVFAVVGLYFWIRSNVLASKRKVKSVTGIVTLVYRRRVGNCISIGDLIFPVAGNQVNGLFKADTPYIIYYAGTSSILSVEEKR